ncbi:MAG: hypothetical protein C5B48_03180 [Candidatus Rokuibacteriota bacterium]|nr:MAG: hypothetical protein C5B48_03180 [Candidatus Rokubacteria bacterium]
MLMSACGADARSAASLLRGSIENVPQATAYRYGARDNEGASLDTLKVIPDPKGGYLGVYHVLRQNVFTVRLARSSNLLTWVHVADLDVHASQPTLAATPRGGFVLADERDNGCTGTGPGGNCLGFRHYPSVTALLAGASDRNFQAPRSLSKCAEGTPNIYSIRQRHGIGRSTIKVGFHYFRDCKVDRQAGGVLRDFSSWSAGVDGRANRILEAFKPGGNIGDRDFASLPGGRFSIHEVQFRLHDFGSWRVFLYDRNAGRAFQLNVKTHHGSTAFANPTFTVLRSPRGRPALLVTLFLPAQGATITEGGELVYYRELRGRAARLLVPKRLR